MARTPEQEAEYQALKEYVSAAKAAVQAVQAQQPGSDPSSPGYLGTPDNAYSTNLLGGFGDRAKLSFGTFGDKKAYLESHGFTDVQENKDGELVAKSPEGRWVKDEGGFAHWTGNHAGGALPVMGAAAMSRFGPGGMAVGAAAGKGVEQAAGTLMGLRKDASLLGDTWERAKEAAEAGLGGLIGQAPLRKIPKIGAVLPKTIDDAVSAGVNKALDVGRKGVAYAGSVASRVPVETVERLIQRPGEVLGVDKAGNVWALTKKMAQDLQDKWRLSNETMDANNAAALARNRGKYLDTTPAIETLVDTPEKYAPGGHMEGYMSPRERARLERTLMKDLTSLEFRPNGVEPDPEKTIVNTQLIMPGSRKDPFLGAETLRDPVYAQPMEYGWAPAGPDMTVHNLPAPGGRVSGAKPVDVQNIYPPRSYEPIKVPVYESSQQAMEVPTISVTPIEKQMYPSGGVMKLQEPVEYRPVYGYGDTVPVKPFEDLMVTANKLSNEIGTAWDKNKFSTRSPKYQGARKHQYMTIRDLLYKADKEWAGQNAEYHLDRNAFKLLKDLGKEKSRENFVNRVANGALTEDEKLAMARMLPEDTMTTVKDLQASRAFDEASDKLGWASMGPAGILGGGILAATRNPEAAITAATLGTLLSPKGVKYGLGTASKMSAPAWRLMRQNADLLAPNLIYSLSPKYGDQ